MSLATKPLAIAGQILGVLAGALVALLWLVVIFFPSGDFVISGISVLVAGFMGLMAMVAGIAAFYGHSVVVFIVFVASFMPVGAYLLGVSHWTRWIGVIDVMFLLAGLMIWIGSRQPREQR